VWFGTGATSKVIAAAMIAFFPVLVSTLRGLDSVDPESLALFRLLRSSTVTTLFKLRIPASLPYLFSGLKIASALAVVGAVVGEFVGASRGIGFVIVYSSYHLETARMYAALLLLAAGGLLLFGIIALVENHFVTWSSKDVE